jgi:hypothetical protein
MRFKALSVLLICISCDYSFAELIGLFRGSNHRVIFSYVHEFGFRIKLVKNNRSTTAIDRSIQYGGVTRNSWRCILSRASFLLKTDDF